VVEDDQWQCRKCGDYCETERQAVRKLPLECGRRECLVPGEEEGKKFWSPGRYREHLREEHGEDVPRNEGRDGAAELASEEWWGSRSPEALCSSVWRCTRCLDVVESRRDGFECPRCGFACEVVRRSYHVGAVEWMDGDGGQ
jgi:rubrerythrin